MDVSLVIATENSVTVRGAGQGEWTYDAWLSLPDDGNRYEIINGVLYMTTAPGFSHQWIVKKLEHELGLPALQLGLGYSLFAPIGVRMPGADPVQPDFVFVRAANAGMIQERGIFGVPDLIIEVLSPGNRAYDREVKFAAYQSAGVPEYAIVDPENHSVTLYTLTPEKIYDAGQVFGEADRLHIGCLPGIGVEVGALFADSPLNSQP